MCEDCFLVEINGIPTKPFPAKKGLRQGDPIFPFLFDLAMEYLSRCLGRVREILLLTLFFFSEIFFSQVSGLEADLDKFQMYFGGIVDDIQQTMLNILHNYIGLLPFRFQGVPLSYKKLSYSYVGRLQ